MRALREVWGELVERRLWPLALLLVVALVAVPLVLAKQPAAEDAADVAVPPAAAAAADADLRSSGEPIVSVAAGAGANAPLRGHAKNPFHQQHVPPRASAGEGGTPPTGGATTGEGQGDSGGTGGGSEPQPRTYVYASIDVRFGRAGSPLRTIHDVPRLTPLPSAADPIVIFLGMRADHETAVFMLSTDVHAQGDGRCVPSTKVCEAIELKRDGVALLDVRAADGSVTQYELDLADVALHETGSQAEASRAYARSSRRGRTLVRRALRTSAVASALRFSPSTGVLDALPGTYLERDDEPADDAGDVPQAAAGATPRAPALTRSR